MPKTEITISILRTHQENEPKENAPAPLYPARRQTGRYAAPHAAMRRCNARSGAHNHAIAARLTSRCALPDTMLLCVSSGFAVGAYRNSLRSNRPTRFFPPGLPMLGAGQRVKTESPNRLQRSPLGSSPVCSALREEPHSPAGNEKEGL